MADWKDALTVARLAGRSAVLMVEKRAVLRVDHLALTSAASMAAM